MLDAILNRRSVRAYRDTPISDEQIEDVLRAGFCAPSAHGNAPWHVVVVREQAAKDILASIHKWSRVVTRVPVAIVVCVDTSTAFEHFWIEDGSAFMENMLIQATSMGLGTCWIGIQGLKVEGGEAEQIVRGALNLPDHFRVLAMTPLGIATRHPGPHEDKLPDDRVHYDSFGRPKPDAPARV